MTLPTAKEINPYGDFLDGRVACKNFLGKSLDQAEALFRENSIHYQEGLMWMGPVAFRFYVTALIRYIQSEAATGDADIINCFAGLLEFRLENEAAELVRIAEHLASVCDYIVQHYGRFNVTPEIYGDVRSRVQTLQQAFLRQTQSR